MVDSFSHSKTYEAYTDGSFGTGSYNVNDNNYFEIGDPSAFQLTSFPNYLEVYPYNNTKVCKYYSAENVNLSLTLGIQVTANCTGSNLDFNTFCQQYCLSYPDKCVNEFVSYCLPPNSSNLPITSSIPCQSFIKDYIQNTNPTSVIDESLSYFCKKKFGGEKGDGGGFTKLFTTGTQVEQDLCACNLPDYQYKNLEDQLGKAYPGYQEIFSTFGFVDRCLLPQCASSAYKTVVTGSKCKIPQCINIINFNNDGTFDNSNIVIDQHSDGCANISGGVPSPPDSGVPLSPVQPVSTNSNIKLIVIIITVV